MNAQSRLTIRGVAQTSTPVQTGILQRKCACGNHTVAGGECSKCGNGKNQLQRNACRSRAAETRSRSQPTIQAKLTVGATNDPLEHEADRIADQVMRAPSNSAVSPVPPRIQRFSGHSAVGGDTAPASVDRVLASSGRPLEPALRNDMEHRFSYDFSSVRVHSNAAAEQSAEDVSADAYTVGRNIVFGAGRFTPGTSEGRRLIAHELTHVIQQSDLLSIKSHRGFRKPSGHSIDAGQAKRVQRQPKKPATPPPVPGGNVLYIGMNNYKPEVAKLGAIYRGTSVKVTTVTVTEDSKTESGGSSFDLNTDSGMLGFARTLTADAAVADEIKKLLAAQKTSDRDDLAHVIAVYALTEKDGLDRMSRVILSGHSYGTKIYNKEVKGAIYFDALVRLASLFPKAAAQTKHLLVLACLAGAEDLVKNIYKKAFPNLQTFWGWTDTCPTGWGAAKALGEWSEVTDKDPIKLAMPPAGQANWAMGVYQTDAPVDSVALMAGLRADESKFDQYFAGTKVDADNHSGFLYEYYRRSRTAEQQTTTIVGADHAYAKLHADQSFRLRFWSAMVSNFWKKNEATIAKGYGSASVPKYGRMSRKDALTAIAAFDSASTATGPDKVEARRLLNALKDLDPAELSDNWLSP